MPQQKERVPCGWTTGETNTAGENDPRVLLSSDSKSEDAFEFSFETLRTNVFRTRFTSKSHPLPPHPSAPPMKADLDGVKLSVSSPTATTKNIEIGEVLIKLDWTESSPLLSVAYTESKDSPILQDLPFRGYAVDGPGVAHYTRYNRDTLHVGLGEKAAPMDLSGRKFEISATDSFGYDVYRTDPLYKNIPLLINATPSGCVATFSTSHTRGLYSIGSEMDGMWGRYKVYRQDYGGLEEYTIVGRTLKDIVRTYAELVGFPLLVPRWAFGYLSGGMKYSMLDDPPASEALLELARKMKEHDIPCSAYQMSSGYTVAETEPKTRNVFTWNRHRFADPEGWIAEYHKLGMRLIANVKPYVLASHPEYEKLKAANAFFTDPSTKQPGVARLWSAGGGESGEGGHIDFTSEAGFQWWYEGVKKLRQQGIDCIWNDNNEYVVTDDSWECALTLPSLREIPEALREIPEALRERPQIGLWGRSMHTELHGRASHDALVDADPDGRPFVLTRGATAGTMRYACSSWSGDNTTSWASMRGSTALGLNAGVSLLHCYGHDIGGFEGPQPSPELLVRWVQLGVYSPRFAINCFKTLKENSVGDVIEPWMHPGATHLVRRAIKRRYALIPYIYSAMIDSHRAATPPQRWIGWGCEADPEVWRRPLTDGETQYWFGDAMVVGGVFEPGATQVKVYLPKKGGDGEDGGYVNMNAPYQYLKAGEWATVDAAWHGAGIAVMAKVGAAIPTGRDVQVLSPGEKDNVAGLPLDDLRAVEIFPPQAGSSSGDGWYETTWHEDDGVSPVARNRISSYTISYSATEDAVKVKFSRDEDSGFTAPWRTLVVVLPVGDVREVQGADGRAVSDLGRDELGRRRFELS
ncbi:neutral alpha-glucosidase ab precursor [Cordyceps fumosorosea ARSEF 2679]|uniref:alpha-glucosidase n=1 Tax=Cordyceps fumosorosea (strain ARSEF 2679) TaxID=1081104 RepID=A0A167YFZ4_CORFA|nr:neutral alpha-glucosidase ab precursor [Cordyceps fumosorosea ARSEF 2679]OAA66278.1 neutral alpha-glucosidase ab precursor [Cordyceps fumosorosea ARSEF 2679]